MTTESDNPNFFTDGHNVDYFTGGQNVGPFTGGREASPPSLMLDYGIGRAEVNGSAKTAVPSDWSYIGTVTTGGELNRVEYEQYVDGSGAIYEIPADSQTTLIYSPSPPPIRHPPLRRARAH